MEIRILKVLLIVLNVLNLATMKLLSNWLWKHDCAVAPDTEKNAAMNGLQKILIMLHLFYWHDCHSKILFVSKCMCWFVFILNCKNLMSQKREVTNILEFIRRIKKYYRIRLFYKLPWKFPFIGIFIIFSIHLCVESISKAVIWAFSFFCPSGQDNLRFGIVTK